MAADQLDAEGTDTSQGTPQLLSTCLAVAQTIATTLGPRGMDKLIVDERGQSTISSQSAPTAWEDPIG